MESPPAVRRYLDLGYGSGLTAEACIRCLAAQQGSQPLGLVLVDSLAPMVAAADKKTAPLRGTGNSRLRPRYLRGARGSLSLRILRPYYRVKSADPRQVGHPSPIAPTVGRPFIARRQAARRYPPSVLPPLRSLCRTWYHQRAGLNH